MSFTTRRVNYKLDPSASQKRAMMQMCENAADLYNAALEQRIEGHRRRVGDPTAPVINLAYQQNDAKALSHLDGWGGSVHSHTTQLVLDRVNKAFNAFFRRLEKGERGGFPRYKSPTRLGGWGYKAHGVGYSLEVREDWGGGFVTLFGIGRMRMLGSARYGKGGPDEVAFMPADARFKGASVSRKADGWHISVEVEVPLRTRPAAEGPAIGLDWGVSTFLTGVESGGADVVIENPRLGKRLQDEIGQAQSAAQKERKRSRRGARRFEKRIARRSQKLSRQRHDHAHKVTAAIVRRNAAIIMESLGVQDMTRSVRETDGLAGWEKAMRTGLNRSVLDTAPAALYEKFRYKAAEAGSEFIELDGRKLKASQTCPGCRAVRKKALSERVHECGCGLVMSRDRASALLALLVALESGAYRGLPPEVPCAVEIRRQASEKRVQGKARKARERLAAADPDTPERRAAAHQGGVETPSIST